MASEPNIGDRSLNPTTCCFHLNVTKKHQRFVAKSDWITEDHIAWRFVGEAFGDTKIRDKTPACDKSGWSSTIIIIYILDATNSVFSRPKPHSIVSSPIWKTDSEPGFDRNANDHFKIAFLNVDQSIKKPKKRKQLKVCRVVQENIFPVFCFLCVTHIPALLFLSCIRWREPTQFHVLGFQLRGFTF